MPTKTKLSIVDPKTGQVVETDAVVYLYSKTQKGKDFIKVFRAFIKNVAMDRELRPALDLLAYIMSEKLERGGPKFYMTAEEAVKTLGISRETYYRWLKMLINRGYITRIGPNYYTLNP